jgi:Gpi18-like mannosyltransferase
MAIIRTIPSRRIINGNLVETSQVSLVSETDYNTNGEECIIVSKVSKSLIILDSKTTDHIVVKSMTLTTVKPDIGKIDEEYDEIVLDKFSCVEFRFVSGNWYILSSDGLKQS